MKKLSAIFAAFLLLATAQFAGAGEVSIIKIEGSAKKAEFAGDTKKEALERALRGSVEMAIKEVMKGEDILENAELIEERIYPNPMNYILNYKILSEGWITHFDLPGENAEPEGPDGIDGEEPSEGDAMGGVELIIGLDGELVAVPIEGAIDDAEVEEVGGEVEVDVAAQQQVAALETLPAKETVVVKRHRKGSLAESSFFTPSAEDISQGVATGIGEGVTGGELLYHLWIETRLDIDRLKEDVKDFSDIEEVEISIVSIEILGVNDQKRFEDLRARLQESGVIKELNYESFSRGRYVLRASVAGTGHDLYDRLRGNLGKDLVLIPGGVGRVIIKLEESTF